jgi:aminocarboxymuconate-semialdehyde decarboxylase
VIDIHAHRAPADLRDRLAADGEKAGARLREDGRVEFASGELTRPLFPELYAPPRAPGCELQVVSPWVDLLGYGLDPDRGARWARLLNRGLEGHPALATVPLQDGAAAAREVEWALAHGFLGVEIGTNARTRELSDPDLEPFWAACEAGGVPVFLHPAYVVGGGRLQSHYLHNLAANPFDTTLAVAHLVFGGVLDRHPRLVLILAHGGGYWPYQFGRFDRGHAVRPECTTPLRPPREYLRAFYYDTVVHSGPALRYLVDLVGADRVLLGTDLPFDMGDPDPLATLRAARLDGEAVDAISRRNALAVFRLDGGSSRRGR